jgi:hypothetical protein
MLHEPLPYWGSKGAPGAKTRKEEAAMKAKGSKTRGSKPRGKKAAIKDLKPKKATAVKGGVYAIGRIEPRFPR